MTNEPAIADQKRTIGIHPRLARADVAKRFFAKVAKDEHSDCQMWQATVGSNGYGEFCLKGKKLRAHRVALILATGHDGDGLHALHSCDRPLCVNPAHLRWGTNNDNIEDRIKRNRSHRWLGRKIGAGNPMAKLTEADVRAIRASGERQQVLADRYGVTASAIWEIVNRVSWTNVSEDAA